MKTFLMTLPLALLTAVQFLALYAARVDLRARDLPLAQVRTSLVLYVVAGVLLLLALVWQWSGWVVPGTWPGAGAARPEPIDLAMLGGLVACLAPLVWGRSIGEFHMSHHAIRAALVSASLVLFWKA